MDEIFNPEIYEVTRDEFKGFLDELKPDCVDYKVYQNEDIKVIRIFAKNDMTRLFAEQIIKPDEISYYVYEMPKNEERQASKPIRKVILETPEEVETFFKALNALQKEKTHD